MYSGVTPAPFHSETFLLLTWHDRDTQHTRHQCHKMTPSLLHFRNIKQIHGRDVLT